MESLRSPGVFSLRRVRSPAESTSVWPRYGSTPADSDADPGWAPLTPTSQDPSVLTTSRARTHCLVSSSKYQTVPSGCWGARTLRPATPC